MNLALITAAVMVFFVTPGDAPAEKIKGVDGPQREASAAEKAAPTKSFEKKSPDGYRHYVRGNGLSNTDPERALEHYKAAIEKGYDTVELRMKTGGLLRTLGRPDEAFEQYHAAIRLNENSVRPHIALAHALLDSERYEEALKEFEIIKKMAPEDYHSGIFSEYIGTCLDRLGKYQDALDEYQAALRCNCNGDAKDARIKKRIKEIKALLSGNVK